MQREWNESRDWKEETWGLFDRLDWKFNRWKGGGMDNTRRARAILIFRFSPNSSKTWRMTLLLHLTVQLPTHHLSHASPSSSPSLKYTCDLPFHLLLLTPLPSSHCTAGSPPPSISLLLSPSHSSVLLFLSIFHTISKCSSLVVQTYFRCTSSPPLLAAVCHSYCLSNTFSFYPPLLSFLHLTSVHLSPPWALTLSWSCLSSDVALILASLPSYKHATHSTYAHVHTLILTDVQNV